MSQVVLVLPYPLSANRYWRTRVIAGKGKPAFVSTYVSSEAEAYKLEVQKLARLAGVRSPIAGRVALGIKLYPNRPQDWERRARKDPAGWSDTVMCIDLDNANKVLLDALKGLVFEDDKWVRSMASERMEPDARGARVVVAVEAMAPVQLPQMELAA